MQEAVLYLSKNPEVLRKIEKGEASLLGVTPVELRAILDSTLLKAEDLMRSIWK